jgi:hypothetical protein
MAHARMVATLILTVFRSAAEASAYLGVGVGGRRDISVFNLCITSTAVDCQKWFC